MQLISFLSLIHCVHTIFWGSTDIPTDNGHDEFFFIECWTTDVMLDSIKYCVFGIWIPQLGMGITNPLWQISSQPKYSFSFWNLPYALNSTNFIQQSRVKSDCTSFFILQSKLIWPDLFHFYLIICLALLPSSQCCSTSLHNFLGPISAGRNLTSWVAATLWTISR
jgi:hypothetical protein